jgi:hypothetical protein
LADIALRALSPAVNDPATAVDTIDATDGLVRALSKPDIDVRDIPLHNRATPNPPAAPHLEWLRRQGHRGFDTPAAPFAMVLVRMH